MSFSVAEAFAQAAQPNHHQGLLFPDEPIFQMVAQKCYCCLYTATIERWPWLAFAVLPLVTFALLFVFSVVLLVEAFEFAEHSLGLMPASSPGLYWLQAALLGNALCVAPLVVAGVACWEAARRRAPVLWPLTGTIVIGLIGAMTRVSLDWSGATPKGTLSGGIGLSSATLLSTAVRTTVTIAVVLIPYFWWRRTHEHAVGEPAK